MGSGTVSDTRWASRSIAARLWRISLFSLPIMAGIVAAYVMARLLSDPMGAARVVGWWSALLVAAVGTAAIAQRLLSRLSSVPMLLDMSLAFPDRAPSRYRVMLRSFTVRGLQRQLHEGTLDPIPGLRDASLELMALLAKLTAHDARTRGHAERVRAYADVIAEEMGLSEHSRNRLRWAALLHDIGKLSVPAPILNKAGPLSDDEWRLVRYHPLHGGSYIRPMSSWLGSFAGAVTEHHERWDGSGYPFGLVGEEISIGARIISVCDAFDAMVSVRTYGERKTPDQARREIAAHAGGQFDPFVVKALLTASIGRLSAPLGVWAWLPVVPFTAGLERFGRQAAVVGAAIVLGLVMLTSHSPEPEIVVAGITLDAEAVASDGAAGLGESPTVDAEASSSDSATGAESSGAGSSDARPPVPPPASGNDPATTDASQSPVTDTTTTTTTTVPPTADASTTATTTTVPVAPVTSSTTTVATTTTTTTTTTATITTTTATTSTTVPTTTTTTAVAIATDDLVAVRPNGQIIIAVLANDSGSVDVQTLQVTTAPDSGTVSLVGGSGKLRYHADSAFTGTDLFEYSICTTDGSCDTATVRVQDN